MKLTEADKVILRNMGHTDEDFRQIEEASRRTTYSMNSQRISAKKALEVLGRSEYLSGISRSAFHYTAARQSDNGEMVYFDSSRLFKRKGDPYPSGEPDDGHF